MPPENNDGGSASGTFNMEALLANMIRDANGDVKAAAAKLARQLKKTRERAQAAEADRDKYKTDLDKLTGEGSVVLSGDEAKQFTELKAKGLTLAQIGERLTAHDSLLAENTKIKSEATTSKAAKVYGYNDKVLLDLLTNRDQEVSFRKVKVKDEAGNEVEQELPHVRKRGDDKTQWVLLDAYATKELKPYLPALTASGEQESDDTHRFTPMEGNGSSASGSARGKDGKDAVSKVLNGRYFDPFATSDKK